MSKMPLKSAPHIRLNIGTVALPGYSKGHGQRLTGALERELGRLMAAMPTPTQDFQAERLLIPHFRMTEGERPERVGQRLARVIAEQLQPARHSTD